MVDRKKIYLKVYQALGFLFLSSLTLGLLGYGYLMVFFQLNTNWIAPTVLTQTSDKMLEFQTGYVTQLQQRGMIRVQYLAAQKQLITYTKQRDDLLAFNAQLKTAIHHEIRADKELGSARQTLVGENNQLIPGLNKSEIDLRKSRSVGLLTEAESTQALVAIQQFKSLNADAAMVANTLIRQQLTLEGNPRAIDAMTAVRQNVDLNTQINTANDNIAIQQKTLDEAATALKQADATIATLEDTAYFAASQHKGANLAFLPYDNAKRIKIGDPVYDCYLLVIVCHKVGTINKIYKDEQIVEFPIFNVRFSRTVRGTLLDMNINENAAMHSSLFFFGNKPMLF